MRVSKADVSPSPALRAPSPIGRGMLELEYAIDHTASESEVKVKSRSFIGGIIIE